MPYNSTPQYKTTSFIVQSKKHLKMCVMASQNAHVEYTCGHSYISKTDPTKHGFIYKNKVTALGKNSMILPIPTSDVSSVVIIDTTSYAQMMDEFYDSCPKGRGVGFNFLKVGIYTLLVGRDIQEMHDNLGISIPPSVSEWLLAHYPAEHFTFITCIWEGDMESQPIQVEYTPTWSDFLFFPMMEAHGDIPEDADVYRYHYLTISTGEQSATQFQYAPDEMYEYYTGIDLIGHVPNGDAYFHIEALDTILDSNLTNITFTANPFVNTLI